MALASVLRTSRGIQVFRPFKEPTASKSVVLLKNASVRGGDDSRLARFLSSKPPQLKTKLDPEVVEKLKKKGLVSPQITLITPDELVTTDTLDNAEKIAKRRNLKLVKIVDFDTKTEKPLYRLMTALEFFQESSKAKAQRKKDQNSGLKEEKLFIMSSKIGEHDLNVKLNQMLKLIKKKHEIRVFISQDGNPTKAEEVVKYLEEELKEEAEKTSQIKKAATLKLLFVPKTKQDAVSDDSGNKSTADSEKTVKAKKKKAEKIGN